MMLVFVALITAQGIGKMLEPEHNVFGAIAQYLIPILMKRQEHIPTRPRPRPPHRRERQIIRGGKVDASSAAAPPPRRYGYRFRAIVWSGGAVTMQFVQLAFVVTSCAIRSAAAQPAPAPAVAPSRSAAARRAVNGHRDDHRCARRLRGSARTPRLDRPDGARPQPARPASHRWAWAAISDTRQLPLGQ